jgi:hypothetical protein
VLLIAKVPDKKLILLAHTPKLLKAHVRWRQDAHL